ncbi:organomercurial transporter MerC [Pseudoalteromonas sp.]|uniref:organomercurial transporter MerC n=1 Tax=Pseudoalteromonas sp. TaxID=53249 RepID=UPI003564A911
MINNILDKIGSAGVWLAALSCTACFPALGSLAAGLGLGFLSHFEGIAINTVLPLFAALALLVNVYNWYQNKNLLRGILSVIGPLVVLLALYPLWQYYWSTYVFYFGITSMVIMSVFDIVKPVKGSVCKV